MDPEAPSARSVPRIGQFAPEAHARELHRIVIDAPREVVWRALWTADLDPWGVAKMLVLLRSLPRLLLRPRQPPLPSWRLTLPLLVGGGGFGILAEEPGRELVIGVAGRFWRPTGGVLPFDPARFTGPLPPGTAKAVWNFALEEAGADGTRLVTETRVVCADATARRSFRLYWWAIRPCSGLIRIVLLRAVRRAALRDQRAHSRQTSV
jgi:hypothetical protein